MTAQFQYTTLAHQAAAVQSLADVFNDVRFCPPVNVQANPTLVPGEAAAALKANITAIRLRNGVTAGDVQVPVTTTRRLTAPSASSRPCARKGCRWSFTPS